MNPKDKHADWLLKPTANELADEVEMWGKDLLALNMKGGIPVIEGAKLLRQQQAEIEAMNLSNEEIGLLTTDPRFSHIESPLLLEFARAILRKAQEK